jgi:hypothetical protein
LNKCLQYYLQFLLLFALSLSRVNALQNQPQMNKKNWLLSDQKVANHANLKRNLVQQDCVARNLDVVINH